MILLNNLTSNEIKFIARDGTPTQVELVDEQTKEETILTPTFTTDGYYMVFTLEHSLKENRRYKLTISSSDEVLYRDLVFVTTQSKETYTTNKDEYNTHSTITDVENITNPKYKII
tara:strand:+ start:4670 stop:5017 length:348 start_codon:yes stop_codon:yes gene_type:complete